MRFITLQMFFYLTMLIGCSSTSSYLCLENSIMCAYIIPINRSGYQPPDTSFAALRGTEWKENKPFKNEHFVGGPKTDFDIHLVKDDSVTIYYTDLQELLIGEPLKTFLKKASYRYEPHFKNIVPGIYIHTCLIGGTKHMSKILLVR